MVNQVAPLLTDQSQPLLEALTAMAPEVANAGACTNAGAAVITHVAACTTVKFTFAT
jgi:hypothetical protein